MYSQVATSVVLYFLTAAAILDSTSQVIEALPLSFRELPGVATQSPLGVRCSICGVFFPAGGQVSSFAFLVPDSSTGCFWDSEGV